MATATTPKIEKATRGPISGPMFCVLLAVFASLLIRFTQVPWWSPAAVAVPAAAAHWYVMRKRHSAFAGIFAVSCWIAGAAWATLTGKVFGYPWPAVVVLIALAVPGFILAQAIAAPAPVPIVPPAPPKVENPRVAKMRNVVNSTLGLRDPDTQCEVTKLEDWETGAGYTAYVTFPPKARVTFPRVQAEASIMASMLQLPNGGQVRIDKGKAHHQVVIHVTTRNKLEENFPFPVPTKPGSLLRPIQLGVFSDGAAATVELRQAAMLTVARRGGGKSVGVATLTGQLAACPDVLIWMIDCNGGSAAMNWMLPFAGGEIDQPIIDWVAADLDEALLMSQAAVAIAKMRKRAYAQLMFDNDTDLLPISSKLPAIIIIVDEGHMVFGSDRSKLATEVATNLDEVMRIGRAMAVQIAPTSQRATQSYLPPNVKVATQIRLVGPVEQDSEIAYAMDWERGLSSRDLTGPGQWFIRRNSSETPTRMKGFSMTPTLQVEVAKATERWRPSLDGPSAATVGEIYSERWVRLDPWLREISGHPVDTSQAMRQVAAATNPELAGRLAAEKVIRDIQNRHPVNAAVPTATVPAPAVGHDDEEDDGEWIAGAVAEVGPVDTAERSTAELMADLGEGPRALYGWIAEASDEGIRTQVLVQRAIAEDLTIRRATVQQWLAILMVSELIERKGGRWATWVIVPREANRIVHAA